jgi:hypothetical protein
LHTAGVSTTSPCLFNSCLLKQRPALTSSNITQQLWQAMLCLHSLCPCKLRHDLQDGLLHQLAGRAPAKRGLCSAAGLRAADACSFLAVS